MNRPAASCLAGPADGSDKILLQRGTVAGQASPTEPAGKTSAKTSMQSLPPGACPGGGAVPPSASSVAVASPGDHQTLAQKARIEFLRIYPMNPAAPCPAGPAEGPDKTPMQRGTVAGPASPTEPAGRTSAKTSIHRGTVPAVQNPFRNALLAGTVCNTPDAHRRAAKVERTGGWPIVMAIDAAIQAGQDWRPATAAIRHRLAEDANRRRPPCIRLAAPMAEVARWHATPEAP
jgi:hypothetical protein